MAAFRAGNGKFVGKDNPIAIIGRLNAQRAARRRDNALQDQAARRAANIRAHGARPYDGPRTRAELAAGAALREL